VSQSSRNLLVNAPYKLVQSRTDRLVQLQVGVEIYIDNDTLPEIDLSDVRRLARELDDRDIIRTVHTLFADLSPGGIDKDIRRISQEKLVKSAEIAGALGAMHIVCHGNYDKWRYDSREDLWLEKSIDTWDKVLKVSENMPVLIENIFDDTPSALISLMKYYKEKNMGICFDTGHFNLFSSLPLDEWLVPLKDRIREFHIHDNYGKKDDHNPIGDGTFPFRELKQFLKSLSGVYFTSEIHSEEVAIDSIKRAKEFLS
jgi:sugar phosphate isomerase/epimerase